jgi:hypothetical protein
MTMPQPGEIWLADIPFTSGLASKLRPILVLWIDEDDVVVAAVTSAAPRSPADLFLQDWSEFRGVNLTSSRRGNSWSAPGRDADTCDAI